MVRFVKLRRFGLRSATLGMTVVGMTTGVLVLFLLLQGKLPAQGAAREMAAEQTLPSGTLASSAISETVVGDAAVAPNRAAKISYLPLIAQNHNSRLSKRIGYGATLSPITRYPAIRSLNAGWYVNWGVSVNAVRPSGMEYAQMIRVHQDIVQTDGCGKYVTADRRICPYVEPHSYSFEPDAATIQAAARANPGSIWLIGNEPDRLDWVGFGQDEMLPELYAVAYKEMRDLIKAADPQAQIAIAGVIQATPMRLEYLTKVWDEYKRLYNADMPVDIWNVHNFILEEVCEKVEKEDGSKEFTCYGSGVVPGSTARKGSYDGMSWAHTNKDIFHQQIVAFRQWMKDHGQATKPLIVSEYGVLYSSVPCRNPIPGGCSDANWVNLQDPQVVQEFMLWSFDYFLNTRDCALSEIDDCRLVQRWLWFSLDHVDGSSNQLGNLMDRNSLNLLPAGQRFKEYTSANHEALSAGY
ncbi:MAG TPA: hypothetical protein P5121_30860 [Caldilineaceae bacterium]|nr:hypothetical protein [Caldilineaceae bacterium]